LLLRCFVCAVSDSDGVRGITGTHGTCCYAVLCVQYQIVMEFMESLERMALADKFRKYHPGVPRKEHYKEWLVSF